jgi:hypothetical protein
LKKYKLNKIHAPLDLMMRLIEIKKIKINGQWYLSDVTQATIDLMNKLKITTLFLRKEIRA